ncbi:MAG: winged helix-turn-helix domain-containing protein [bacterium]
MRSDFLSLDEARRIALAAQGFDRARPRGGVNSRHVLDTIRRLGLIQIDYVNVVVPSHYQVPFSRLGPYDRSLLHEVVYRRRAATEQWAHEASILPVESWPFLRHRMDAHDVGPRRFQALMRKHAAYAEWVLAEVRARGPLTADDLPGPEGVERRIRGSWIGTVPRAVLEAFFARGVLAVADRRPNFARAFDLAERVVPEEHLGRVMPRDEAQRALLLRAARAHGVGIASDLADYYRMSVGEARPRIAELVREGALREVRVDGWRETAYLHPDARRPRAITAAALLSPFDPVVWRRARTARLFGFDFRFEIFVPSAQRRWGCYVLPFLLGDRLVARVDLKSDRTARRLRVLAAQIEDHADPNAVAPPLAAELRTMAAWLGFDAVTVGRRGSFARRLAAALRA